MVSCNAISNHGIVWIEREAEKALQDIAPSIDYTTVKDLTLRTRRHWAVKVKVLQKLHPHPPMSNSRKFQRLILVDKEKLVTTEQGEIAAQEFVVVNQEYVTFYKVIINISDKPKYS